jgi:hypothetical protein
MKLPRTIISTGLFVLVLLTGSASAGSEAARGGKTFSVLLSPDNLLTVRAENIALEEVLAEIANQASIKISFHGPAKQSVRMEFSDLPLEEGLRRLTKNFNSVFVYGPVSGGNTGSRIEEVIIYAKSDTGLPNKPIVMVPERAKGTSLEKRSGEGFPTRDEESLPSFNQGQQEHVVGAQLDPENARAVVDLGKILLNEEDEDAKVMAAERMGDLGNEMALVPLMHALGDKSPTVRKSAADALSRIGGEHVKKALERSLTHENPDLRESAAEILERIEATESGAE